MSFIKYPYYPDPNFESLKVQGNNVVRSILHGGKREHPAGNTGTGQSAPGYQTPTPETTIAGVRTTAQTFTRDAGTWVIDALIDQYVFSYVAGVEDEGIWLKITDNTATIITVAAAEGDLWAVCDRVITCPWKPIQNEYAHGQGASAFQGGCFDGESIWLVPADADNVVKVNVASGEITAYVHGQGNGAFSGAVFDGENIWLVPYNSDNLVKVDPSDGSMTTYSMAAHPDIFQDGVFDGENIWLVPFTDDNLIKVSVADGSMTAYAHGQGASAFRSGVFDGTYVWLIPYNANNIVRVDPSDGSMTTYSHPWADTLFIGGIFDGESIWFISYGLSSIVKFNPKTGETAGYAHGQGGTAFAGGCFDGESIWLIPYSSDNLVKLNPADGSMIAYPHGKDNLAFWGGIFDGESVWMIPYDHDDIISFIPPRFGRPSLHTTGPLNVGGDILPAGDSSGLPFGNMYGDAIGLNLAAGNTAAGTWYNVVAAACVDGKLHNVTHDGNGKLTVTYAGYYLVTVTTSLESSVADDHLELGVEVNTSGAAAAGCHGHLHSKFADEEECMTEVTLLDLAAGDTLEATIRSTDGGAVVTVDHVGLVCVLIGGT